MINILPPTSKCKTCGDHRLSVPFEPKKHGYWHCGLQVKPSVLRLAAATCVLCRAVITALDADGACDMSLDPELRVASRPDMPMKVSWEQGPSSLHESYLQRQLYTPEGKD